jgi:very-short-patch-repair endonuclease
MKQTIEKLHSEAIEKVLPIAHEMEAQGVDQVKILDYVERYLTTKRNIFYKQLEEPQPLKSGIFKVLESMQEALGEKKKKADSHSEEVFYHLLRKYNIEFDFQFKIGPYRVDYLIEKVLIFEGDGPQHSLQEEYDEKRDKYLRKMGYLVFRLRWSVVALLQDRVIEEIINQLKELGIKKYTIQA